MKRRGKPRAAAAERKPRRWLRWLIVAPLLLLLAYQVWLFGWVLWWKWVNPRQTSFMALRLEEMQVRQPEARLRYDWADYRQISPHLKRAIIAAEDARFVEHEGFDWDGLQKAMEKNLRKGRLVAGGSTLSQQLAKNLLLSPDRTPWRKAQEAVITVMLETVMDKERIFELYLNVAEWGEGVFGAQAAAHRYFGVSAAQLTPPQAARLAAMLPNPRFYDRNRGAPGLERKTGIILARMNSAELPN